MLITENVSERNYFYPSLEPSQSAAHRDAIYSTMLRRHLSLKPSHEADLLARGLSREQIRNNGYASTPNARAAAEIVEVLAPYGLEGVPGFFRDHDRWRMVRTVPGYFVPVRDEHARIQGLQYRVDVKPGSDLPKYLWLSSSDREGGASSGTPIHFAHHHLMASADEVVVTEGALKADIAAHLSGAPVIGIAGVTCFKSDFAEHLRETYLGLRRVIVAYDRDLLEKPQVYQALTRLTDQLTDARFQVRVRTWPPPWKGYDDYLLSQLNQQEVAA
jgi:DNA primase